MESIERYEQKYLISPREALAIKQSIVPYVRPDRYTKQSLNHRYCVLSLYLDGINRPLYSATTDQSSARLKLRIRTYGGQTCFLEVKRKIRGMVWKSRVMLNPEQYHSLFSREASHMTRAERQKQFAHLNSNQRATLDEFLWWSDRYQARPYAWVGYEREGYESPDGDYARITFDYQVKGKLSHDYSISPSLIQDYYQNWQRVDFATELRSKQAGIILELKSEKRVPEWMSRLSQIHNLSAMGVSKYTLTVDSSDVIRQQYRTSLQRFSTSI